MAHVVPTQLQVAKQAAGETTEGTSAVQMNRALCSCSGLPEHFAAGRALLPPVCLMVLDASVWRPWAGVGNSLSPESCTPRICTHCPAPHHPQPAPLHLPAQLNPRQQNSIFHDELRKTARNILRSFTVFPGENPPCLYKLHSPSSRIKWLSLHHG